MHDSARGSPRRRVRPRREPRVRSRAWTHIETGWPLQDKILFYFDAVVHESIILLSPPPTCTPRTIAILLHVYCAIYDARPTPLVYAIQDTILIITVSCNGQETEDTRW